jgi:hypothetical protein
MEQKGVGWGRWQCLSSDESENGQCAGLSAGTMRCPPCNYLAPSRPHPTTCPFEEQATWDEAHGSLELTLHSAG